MVGCVWRVGGGTAAAAAAAALAASLVDVWLASLLAPANTAAHGPHNQHCCTCLDMSVRLHLTTNVPECLVLLCFRCGVQRESCPTMSASLTGSCWLYLLQHPPPPNPTSHPPNLTLQIAPAVEARVLSGFNNSPPLSVPLVPGVGCNWNHAQPRAPAPPAVVGSTHSSSGRQQWQQHRGGLGRGCECIGAGLERGIGSVAVVSWGYVGTMA